jgi:hypothetical protein
MWKKGIEPNLKPCSFRWFSGISSHPTVFFSHNKPANSTFSHNNPDKPVNITFSHNNPAKRTDC